MPETDTSSPMKHMSRKTSTEGHMLYKRVWGCLATSPP